MKEIKEVRQLNLIFTENGNGSISVRLVLPKKWINEMNRTKENKSVRVSFDGEKIIIEKSI